MEKYFKPKCHICQETDYRALHCDEVYRAKVPKSKKTILDVIRHICRVLKITFNVPALARICKDCYKDLVRYDYHVVVLLETQKRLSDKINASIKGKRTVNTTGANAEKGSTKDAESNADDDSSQDNDYEDNEDIDDEKCEVEVLEDDDYEGKSFTEQNTASTEPLTTGQQQENENIQDNYPCTVCRLKLKNKKALDFHLENDHKGRVTCNVCGVQVRNDEYLALHMNLHNGKTEYDCSFCDKSFARRVNVIRHMQVHFNKKQHQCERCGMFFTQTTIFYNHRLQHEAEDNPLICSICSQSFKTIRTYKRHMITHQKDRPRYSCEYCAKIFVDKYTLKMHIRTHHSNTSGGDDSQEQTSNECQKRVKEEIQDPVIYTCVICQHIFIRQDLFSEHMQNVHDVVMDT